MPVNEKVKVAIVDYGLGNLFSVRNACLRAGIESVITSSHEDLDRASAIILPGVGAFGDAMSHLRRMDLVAYLREVALSNKPLIGICLGMQLFMTESEEFGTHRGLGLIEGSVQRFENPMGPRGPLKVPAVGWQAIERPGHFLDREKAKNDPWDATPLANLPPSPYMYFVHSNYVKPSSTQVTTSVSHYGDFAYCSSLQVGNLYGFQFHPERSGPDGAHIYHNIANLALKHNVASETSHAA